VKGTKKSKRHPPESRQGKEQKELFGPKSFRGPTPSLKKQILGVRREVNGRKPNPQRNLTKIIANRGEFPIENCLRMGRDPQFSGRRKNPRGVGRRQFHHLKPGFPECSTAGRGMGPTRKKKKKLGNRGDPIGGQNWKKNKLIAKVRKY